ncbi:hypothetical protein BKA62DRAFT_435837 [Auriculariales sp. MPI-PUGE-AT-0066]|nr:hypothetical protein BKA62DRAFT_435837 [Auriculariales sp. MPI-PUGE-AT-0066]
MPVEEVTVFVPPPSKQPGSLEARIRDVVYPLSHSPRPSWTLASAFALSAVLPVTRFPHMPNIFWRLGFTWVFAGTGYMISTGDIRNGSGTTTGCALIYLFYNARDSLRRPRSGPSVLLTAATVGIAGIYGSEYFKFRRFDDEHEYKLKF